MGYSISGTVPTRAGRRELPRFFVRIEMSARSRITVFPAGRSKVTKMESASSGSAVAPVRYGAMALCFAVSMLAANVWLLLLLKCTIVVALVLDGALLVAFAWWAKGGGPPRAIRSFRADAFRNVRLSSAQWGWGLMAAMFFAVSVHASLVLLFRLVPYPVAAFRHGYDLSFLASQAMQWMAVIFSAASAAICEESAFRGFIQRPLESRHGVSMAVGVSSLAFTAVHLSKSWAVMGMIPIVLGAGILLGLIANASASLLPGMVGHFVMDVGLFGYWWTGIAGEFRGRPISETGVDAAFAAACCVLAVSLGVVLLGILRLRRVRVGARAEAMA